MLVACPISDALITWIPADEEPLCGMLLCVCVCVFLFFLLFFFGGDVQFYFELPCRVSDCTNKTVVCTVIIKWSLLFSTQTNKQQYRINSQVLFRIQNLLHKGSVVFLNHSTAAGWYSLVALVYLKCNRTKSFPLLATGRLNCTNTVRSCL